MKNYDLIVVGGGISGVAAAVSAAREGLSVLLIERFGSLGGAMSNSLVYPFMKHRMRHDDRFLLSAGIFTEMKQRHRDYGDLSWETYKFVFDDMATEAGVELLFHATVISAASDERKILSIQVATKMGVLDFSAQYFIDASGDGDLIALSGCSYQLGRESDGYCQPMTTCFRVCGVDTDRFFAEEDKLQEIYQEYQKQNKLINPRENILCFKGPGHGVVHFNTTRIVKHDPTNAFDVSRAEIQARRQIQEMLCFLKKHSTAFEHASLVSIASQIGIRESRKLKGVHVLTADELKACTRFEDSIAIGNYDIDIHNPSGSGTYIYTFGEDEYFSIPYRSLLPKEYDNLLVAGRCLSADHTAHSAVRIMPICACIGEAAGVAASIAKKNNQAVQAIDIASLQALLKQKGAKI